QLFDGDESQPQVVERTAGAGALRLEGKDKGRVVDLELRVVRIELRRGGAQEGGVELDRPGQVGHVQRGVKLDDGRGPIRRPIRDDGRGSGCQRRALLLPGWSDRLPGRTYFTSNIRSFAPSSGTWNWKGVVAGLAYRGILIRLANSG